MPIEFYHMIVKVRDRQRSAAFYSEILGLPPATASGPFLELGTANGVRLHFADTEGDPVPAHYAFLVSEEEFDAIHARLRDLGLHYWADPFKQQPGSINTDNGGRGLYWEDPDRHWLEISTTTGQ